MNKLKMCDLEGEERYLYYGTGKIYSIIDSSFKRVWFIGGQIYLVDGDYKLKENEFYESRDHIYMHSRHMKTLNGE